MINFESDDDFYEAVTPFISSNKMKASILGMDEQVQQKFSDLTRKLINQVLNTDIPSIFSHIELDNLKSMTPCNPIEISIINFSGKKVKFIWIDYDGKARQDLSRTLRENVGSILKINSYTNHLYRIQFDADDSSSETIHFRIPEDKNNFYFGEVNKIEESYLQLVYDSCWISNPSIKLDHLDLLEKSIDHKLDQLTKIETVLLQSYGYDDSSETSDLINSFYESFSSDNKFTDPFYDPLSKLDSECTTKRVSEHDVSTENKIYPSVYWGEPFSFKIVNDTDKDFVLYWIDYKATAKRWTDLKISGYVNQNSHLGNVWAISDESETKIFQLGKKPFLKTDCSINLSSIGNSYDFGIESYQPEKTHSLIIHPDVNIEYNSRQGQIGNCWFLQTLISIYAAYPDKISSLFIRPEMVNSTGVVMVRLWSKDNECWRLIIMDDYLPLNEKNNWFCSGPLGELNNIFWVPLIEKAVSKQIGTFKNLASGLNSISVNGLFHLILGPELKDVDDFNVPEDENDLSAFEKLVENFKKKNVCCMASRHSKNKKLIDEETGMVSYHGYGLLDIVENICETDFIFVKCQNTWSKGGEWSGDWGDSSDLWNQYPQIKEALNFEKEDDGTF
ncbi:calpain family cysteine protease, partial [Brachionus plicatilis]